MGRKKDISKLIAMQLAEFAPEVDRAPIADEIEPTTGQSLQRMAEGKAWVVVAATSVCTLVVMTVATGVFYINARSVGGSEVNELDSIFNSAVVANEQIEKLLPEDKPNAIAAACKTLGTAIARLGFENPQKSSQLRRLLIPRLLQMEEPRFTEVERQIVLLNELPADPQCVRWMAMALVGQVNKATYKQRNSNKYQQSRSYWEWLSHQPPGEVLFNALDHNPTDIKLMAHLVELADQYPESFAFEEQNETDGGEALTDQLSLRQRVQQRVAQIDHDDSSYSLLVRHRFESTQDSTKAFELLLLGANRAERRLLLLGDTLAIKHLACDSLSPLSAEQPILYRDFLLLLEVAEGLHKVDPQLAERYYDCLKSVRRGSFPASSVEKAHLLSGQLAYEQGHLARAVNIWRQGIERANNRSLSLSGSIIKLIPKHGATLFQQGGQDVLSEYQSVIEDNAARLANASENELTFAQRKELGRQIRAARWRYRVADSYLLSKTESIGAAMEQLRLALTQSANVQPIEEQRGCVQLAEWYLAEGAADNAATYFERAINLAPNNDQVRERAAEAWDIAGNQSRAAEHRHRTSGAASLQTKLATLESTFQQTLSQHDGIPDARSLLQKVRLLQQEVYSRRSDIQASETLRKFCSRLEIIQACLPSDGTNLERHVASIDFQRQISSIAQEYRDVESIQRFAVECLAVLGANRDSELALEALIKLCDADSSEVGIVRARAMAASGRPLDASKLLICRVGKTDAETRQIMMLAAKFAMRANDVELAYTALNQIANSQRTCLDLFTLARLSSQLPADGQVLCSGTANASELVARWTGELVQRERGSCGFSNFLKAESVIKQLVERNDEIASDDPQLVLAQRTIRELISLRPLWTESIILASDLAVIEGNQQQASRMLRDAILAGEDDPQLCKRLNILQAETQNSTKQWGTLVSSKRVIERRPSSASVMVKRLLDAHKSIAPSNIFGVANGVSFPLEISRN